ncbi:hypothetical protein [Microbacterium sp. MMO-10]|uniref:hypothetical protein n=1 Tax=Microbacterium sp. MMO-10 TaxID=3081272 RepID=UPI003018CC26
MVANSNDSVTGRPIFDANGAADTAGDPNAVATYAAEVGNRIVKANKAALDAYAYKRAGLAGFALDTKTEYVHNGSGWVRTNTGLTGFAFYEPASAPVLATALTTISGIALTGMPTGSPMLMDCTLVASNGQSGGERYIDVQVMNGTTAVGPNRRYALPNTGGTANYTIVQLVPVTPTSPDWSLKLGCDQASSVLLRNAAFRLSFTP